MARSGVGVELEDVVGKEGAAKGAASLTSLEPTAVAARPPPERSNCLSRPAFDVVAVDQSADRLDAAELLAVRPHQRAPIRINGQARHSDGCWYGRVERSPAHALEVHRRGSTLTRCVLRSSAFAFALRAPQQRP